MCECVRWVFEEGRRSLMQKDEKMEKNRYMGSG